MTREEAKGQRMSELLELAARVEALTGPCRETDGAVAIASGLYVREKRGRDRQEWFYPTGPQGWRRTIHSVGYERLPDFTGSLDAARSLVPEGWTYEANQGPSGQPHIWHLLTIKSGDVRYTRVSGRAATLELALTVAALRARAEMADD